MIFIALFNIMWVLINKSYCIHYQLYNMMSTISGASAHMLMKSTNGYFMSKMYKIIDMKKTCQSVLSCTEGPSANRYYPNFLDLISGHSLSITLIELLFRLKVTGYFHPKGSGKTLEFYRFFIYTFEALGSAAPHGTHIQMSTLRK